MKHEEVIKRHAAYHSEMTQKLKDHDATSLPERVDKKKLAKVYKLLEEYEFVFRRKKR